MDQDNKDLVPFNAISSAVDMRQRIAVGDQLSAQHVLSLALDQKVRHIVQDSSVCRDTEINFARLMISKPELFFRFPLSSILSPSHIGSEDEQHFCLYDHRFPDGFNNRTALDEIGMLVHASFSSESMAKECMSIADELLSCLISNRVADSSNDPNSNWVRLFVGWDRERLVIGCEDRSGTLNAQKLLSDVRLCYLDEHSDTINFEATDSGLCNYLAFAKCQSLYIGISKNQRTLICGTLSTIRRQRLELHAAKNLHLWEGDLENQETTDPLITMSAIDLNPDPANEITLRFDKEIVEGTGFGDPSMITSERLIIDLEAVPYINSVGIRNWIMWVRELEKLHPKIRIELVKIPPLFSKLALRTAGLIPANAVVPSYIVCFACPNCDNLKLKIQKNSSSTSSTKSEPMPSCSSCKVEMELDTPQAIIDMLKAYSPSAKGR